MKLLCLLFSLFAVGCTTMRPSIQEVKVPIGVRCQAEVPTRPIMPTNAISPALKDDALIFAFAKAAAAEIELRDGYEDRLLAALHSCR